LRERGEASREAPFEEYGEIRARALDFRGEHS
jgi:hypothetical protein